MSESNSEVPIKTVSELLEFYDYAIQNPNEVFRPSGTRKKFASYFADKLCPNECGSKIEPENWGFVEEFLCMLCESCWTMSWLSDKPIESQSYCVTFVPDQKLSKIQAAELAYKFKLWSEETSVENCFSDMDEMFPAIESEDEGYFFVDYVPLMWTNEMYSPEDDEEIQEIRGMSLAEKFAYYNEISTARLADYGWSDNQEWLLECFSKMEIDGITFEVTVGDWNDSSVLVR
jgi:hypothetical protein